MKIAPALLVSLTVATGCGRPSEPAALTVWNGERQSVGRRGVGQPDHNVMGVARGDRLTYRLNDGEALPATRGEGRWGFRRLGGDGHFNIEVPIDSLVAGVNRLELIAAGSGDPVRREVVIERIDGTASLPFATDWSSARSPYEYGQIVDGEWTLEDGGLRSREPLYDRLFLMGDATWRDYQVRTSFVVHGVPAENAPMSGGSGLGVILRFAGHSIDPPRFPEADPKWGYQPFGAIAWLRWSKTSPGDAPVRQVYRGDRDELEDHAPLAGFATGVEYALRARCVTDPDDASTTTYRLSVWPSAEAEPEDWDLSYRQSSDAALRAGGCALVAHHVDVTFGDVRVDSVE